MIVIKITAFCVLAAGAFTLFSDNLSRDVALVLISVLT